jgi:hypothetical protein
MSLPAGSIQVGFLIDSRISQRRACGPIGMARSALGAAQVVDQILHDPEQRTRPGYEISSKGDRRNSVAVGSSPIGAMSTTREEALDGVIPHDYRLDSSWMRIGVLNGATGKLRTPIGD